METYDTFVKERNPEQSVNNLFNTNICPQDKLIIPFKLDNKSHK